MNNLSKRIITSIILIFILSISLFYNKYIWLFNLIFVSLVLFIEFNNLVNRIWKKEKKTIFKFNIFSSLFLLILIYVSYESYNNFLYHSIHLLMCLNIVSPPSSNYFFQNIAFLLTDLRSSHFSLANQPAAKPTINPIVKNIIAPFSW